jgi:hypothetical protein
MNKTIIFLADQIIKEVNKSGTVHYKDFPWAFTYEDPDCTHAYDEKENRFILYRTGISPYYWRNNALRDEDEFRAELIREIKTNMKSGLKRVTDEDIEVQRAWILHSCHRMTYTERLAIEKARSSDYVESLFTFNNQLYFHMGCYGGKYGVPGAGSNVKISKATHIMIKRYIKKGGPIYNNDFLKKGFVESMYEYNVLSRYFCDVPKYSEQKQKGQNERGYEFIRMNYLKSLNNNIKTEKLLGVAKNSDGVRFHVTKIVDTSGKRDVMTRDMQNTTITLTKKRVYRVVVNAEKGTIYMCVSTACRTKEVKNATYMPAGGEAMECNLIQDYLTPFLYQLRKNQGYYVKEDYSLRHLVRFPNLTEVLFDSITYFPASHKIPMNVSGDGEACKIMGIPMNLSRNREAGFVAELMSLNTKRKKLITIDEAKTIAHLIYLNMMGYHGHNGEINPIVEPDNYVMQGELILQYKNVAIFIKLLLKNGWTCKKIVNWACMEMSHLTDTAHFGINNLVPRRTVINLIMGTKEPRVLHDALYQIKRALMGQQQSKTNGDYKNEVIPYRKGLKEFMNRKVDKYSFALIEDTDEAVHIGAVMDHCVGYGGYIPKAMAGLIQLVGVRNSKGYYVNCMEISKNSVIQAKCFKNHYPSGELRDAIRKYCKETKIDYSRCHDLSSNCYTISAEQADMFAEDQNPAIAIELEALLNNNANNNRFALQAPVEPEVIVEENENHDIGVPLPERTTRITFRDLMQRLERGAQHNIELVRRGPRRVGLDEIDYDPESPWESEISNVYEDQDDLAF